MVGYKSIRGKGALSNIKMLQNQYLFEFITVAASKLPDLT